MEKKTWLNSWKIDRSKREKRKKKKKPKLFTVKIKFILPTKWWVLTARQHVIKKIQIQLQVYKNVVVDCLADGQLHYQVYLSKCVMRRWMKNVTTMHHHYNQYSVLTLNCSALEFQWISGIFVFLLIIRFSFLYYLSYKKCNGHSLQQCGFRLFPLNWK